MYAGAYAGNVVKGLNTTDEFTILGECLDYYYVELNEHRGFVLKNRVNVKVDFIKVFASDNHIFKGDEVPLQVEIFPSIAQNNKTKWYIVNKGKDCAIELNQNVVKGKRSGTAVVKAESGGNESVYRIWVKDKKTNKSWIKLINAIDNEPSNVKIQGLSGCGNRLFYVRVYRSNKQAILYTASIKGEKNGKHTIVGRKAIARLDRSSHINGMVAEQTKNNYVLYTAPLVDSKGKIKKFIFPKSYIDKPEPKSLKNLPRIKSTNMSVKGTFLYKGINRSISGMKFSGIALYDKDKKLYFIKAGHYNILCQRKGQSFIYIDKFFGEDTYTPHGYARTSKAGSACDDKGNYYLVYSFIYDRNDKNMFNYELRGKSYIIKRKITVSKKNGKLKLDEKRIKKSLITYEYHADNKVTWKKKADNKMVAQFEMEDAYIYDNMLFFNTEGGQECVDLIGRSKK